MNNDLAVNLAEHISRQIEAGKVAEETVQRLCAGIDGINTELRQMNRHLEMLVAIGRRMR